MWIALGRVPHTLPPSAPWSWRLFQSFSWANSLCSLARKHRQLPDNPRDRVVARSCALWKPIDAMSALQRQLASIAASANNEFDLKAQKKAHSKSLLFDRAEAASQSYETIYQICIEGFEELCSLDKRFVRYGKSIFSIQSQSEDRQLMTSTQNEELNQIIDSFLGLVGGRLSLTPALKAVEWLVRRFRYRSWEKLLTIVADYFP